MPLREYSRDRIERPSPFRPTDRRISCTALLAIVCHARASSCARVRVRGVPARACVRVARHAQTWRSAERSSTWPSDSPRSLRGLGRLHNAHVAELKCRLLPSEEQVAGPGADVAGVGPVPVQMCQGQLTMRTTPVGSEYHPRTPWWATVAARTLRSLGRRTLSWSAAAGWCGGGGRRRKACGHTGR